MAKLTKKQNNQITVKALENAAKQVAKDGVQNLKEGSYPYDLSCKIHGELNVNKGSRAGKDIEVVSVKETEIMRGMLASLDAKERESLISKAITWHNKATKEQVKEADESNSASILKVAKRRKIMTKKPVPAKAGQSSSKPTVVIEGTVGSNEVKVEVKTD